MTVFFSPQRPHDYATAKRADTSRYARFFSSMLDAGIYLAPSQFEAMFVSLAHMSADLDRTVDAARGAFATARADA